MTAMATPISNTELPNLSFLDKSKMDALFMLKKDFIFLENRKSKDVDRYIKPSINRMNAITSAKIELDVIYFES